MTGFLVLLLLSIAAASTSKTPRDFSLTTSGFGYEKAYLVPSSGRLEFTVKTERDAYILFVENAVDISHSYKQTNIQFALGLGRNTWSTITAGNGGAYLGYDDTEGIVSETEARGFWIQINADYIFEIGTANSTTSFMRGQADPLDRPYFALSSRTEVTADWVVKGVEG